MKTDYLKQAYFSPTKEKLESLIDFLEELGGRKYKDVQISNFITKTNWQIQDSKTLFRVHIQVIVEYLKETTCNYLTDEKIIKSIIGDITEVFRSYENPSEEDLDLILLSINVLPSFIHFKHAKALFINKQIGCTSEKSNFYDLLSIFGARLALEKRVFSMLKIDYVLIGEKPISLSKIINLIQNLKSFEFNDNLDWKLIQKINKWLNHYIHRQIRPSPWGIYKIFQYLEIILGGGMIERDGRKIYSFYYSTIVVDESKMDIELENKLKEIYSSVEIKWSNFREAISTEKE